jgi:hypothetical protein
VAARLPSFAIDAGVMLQHVSRVVYRDGQLHYGRAAANRYDDPQRDYGVLYLALDLHTALMESVFHEHAWHTPAQRKIALPEIESRLVRAVGVLEALRLADLTSPGIMASYFGLNMELLSMRDYTHTHQVSARVHAMSGDDGAPRFDGVYYPSRNNYPDKSIALFERAAAKVKVFTDIDLVDHHDWPDFVDRFDIVIEPDPGPAMRD